MIRRTLANIFTKVKVQKQLYIIFFIAIFIPTVTIGNYLVYHTRSLLLKHYEEQVYSDNLRVKSLLLDLTSNIHYKANSLNSDKELVRLLCTEYDSPQEATQMVEAYEGFNNLLSQDIPIRQVSVYTWNTTLPEGKYIHQITENIQKESWFKQASTTVTPFWTEEISLDDFGNQELVLCLYSRIFLPQINSYAIVNLSISNNHIKNRIQNNGLHTAAWLNHDPVFYCSVRQGIDSALYEYVAAPGTYYLGKMEFEDQAVIGCVSSLSTVYSTDWFYVASLNYDGYAYINKITSAYLAILVLILIITSTFIYAYSLHPSGILGPEDFAVGETTNTLIKIINGEMPAGIAGSFNLCDVRDLAHGTIMAADKGTCGSCYILGNEEVNFQEFTNMVAEEAGCKKVRLFLPIKLAGALAKSMEKKAKKTGKTPMLTSFSIYNLARNNVFDSSKAKRELGYTTRSYRETIHDEIKWLKAEGKIS